MASPFSTPPHPVTGGVLSPFEVAIPDSHIQKLKTLLELCPIAAPNYANSAQHGGRFGVTRDWLSLAVAHWASPSFDWRAHEAAMNSVPHFTLDIVDDYDASGTGAPFTIHFAAIFSQHPDATPVLLMHGWPGSFTEFLPILSTLRERYAENPAALPYHLVVPSLTGFGFSPAPPPDADFTPVDQARVMAKAMAALGFGKRAGNGGGGYVVQGGDVGSIVASAMAALYDDVKGVHLNMLTMAGPPKGLDIASVRYTEREVKRMQAGKEFFATGSDYARLHGNRPSTAGLAICSSPVALLAWIGEKMLAWSDPATVPPLDEILRNVSIYWFTGCYPTSIWFYRNFVDRSRTVEATTWRGIKGKPLGFSSFRKEINPPPKAWLDSIGVVSWYREHEQGGHFAALEQPHVLWNDIVDFIKESL